MRSDRKARISGPAGTEHARNLKNVVTKSPFPMTVGDLGTRLMGCLQCTTTKILPYNISTHVCKLVRSKITQHDKIHKKVEISQKSFPAKNLLKQTTYLLLEAKTLPISIVHVQTRHTQTVHIIPFSKEP